MQDHFLVKLSIVMVCTVAGAVVAALAPTLLLEPTQQRALAMSATALGTAGGLLLLRAGWMPLIWCACGYIWSVFVAAWLERRLVGPVFGGVAQHQIYWTLVIVLQSLAGMAISATQWRARHQPEQP